MSDVVSLLLEPPRRTQPFIPKLSPKMSLLKSAYMQHTISKDPRPTRNSKSFMDNRKKAPKHLPPLSYTTFLNDSIQIKYNELRSLFKKT